MRNSKSNVQEGNIIGRVLGSISMSVKQKGTMRHVRRQYRKYRNIILTQMGGLRGPTYTSREGQQKHRRSDCIEDRVWFTCQLKINCLVTYFASTHPNKDLLIFCFVLNLLVVSPTTIQCHSVLLRFNFS